VQLSLSPYLPPSLSVPFFLVSVLSTSLSDPPHLQPSSLFCLSLFVSLVPVSGNWMGHRDTHTQTGTHARTRTRALPIAQNINHRILFSFVRRGVFGMPGTMAEKKFDHRILSTELV
jgi:uncharacterized membrane protein